MQKLFSHNIVNSSDDYCSDIIVEMRSYIMKDTQDMSNMIQRLHKQSDRDTSARQADPPPQRIRQPAVCGDM
jgi:hypothetical protein